MKILFLQTADSVHYRHMLEITSQTVMEYCARHDCSYESFIGIKRGYHPWHATFNRIPMLASLMNEGFSGWVIYLDADAYLHDLDFDIRGYLAQHSDRAFIAAPDGFSPAVWYRVNAGIFALNFGHAGARRIIQGWRDAFLAITDEALEAATHWDMVRNDQGLLFDVLQNNPDLEQSCFTTSSVCAVLNYRDAQFIRQVLRAAAKDGMEQRLKLIQSQVALVLGKNFKAVDTVAAFTRDAPVLQEEFVYALYRALLLREPDPGGLSDGVKVMANQEMGFTEMLRSCLASEEFRRKIEAFLATYLAKDQLRALSVKLSQIYGDNADDS